NVRFVPIADVAASANWSVWRCVARRPPDRRRLNPPGRSLAGTKPSRWVSSFLISLRNGRAFVPVILFAPRPTSPARPPKNYPLWPGSIAGAGTTIVAVIVILAGQPQGNGHDALPRYRIARISGSMGLPEA